MNPPCPIKEKAMADDLQVHPIVILTIQTILSRSAICLLLPGVLGLSGWHRH
jgi:hypothetical protein